MYKVFLRQGNNTYLFHDLKVNKSERKIKSGTITQGINTISSFSFNVLKNNIAFHQFYPFSSLIEVYNTRTKKYDFKGRILKIKPSMNSNGLISKNIICEDRLGYLQDSIQPYLTEKYWQGDSNRTGLEEFIDYILENHNNQVDDYKKIYRGIINVKPFENSNDITKGLNYESTWEVIQKKLIDSFGGEIQLREVNSRLYLDYLTEIGEESSTVIEVIKNMKSVDKEINPTNFITNLIPLGSKLNDTEERLTIASVNNGSIFLKSNEISNIGSITKTVIFDDVTEPSNLLIKAKQFLNSNNKINEKHTINVLNLHLIDDNYEDFKVGNYYQVKNNFIDLDEKLRITKKVIDVVSPQNNTIDIGDTTKSLSSLTIANVKNNDNQLELLKNNYNSQISNIVNMQSKNDEQIQNLKNYIGEDEWNIAEIFDEFEIISDVKYKKSGNIVSIIGSISLKNDIESNIDSIPIFNLPVSYRSIFEEITFFELGTKPWILKIEENGDVSFFKYQLDENIIYEQNDILSINVTYLI